MVATIIMAARIALPMSSTSSRPRRLRALLFDAGNTLIHMNYAAIAAYLSGRGRSFTAHQVADAERRARVRLDDDLATGSSTESMDTHGRYLRYVLLHLGITDEDEVQEIARWRRGYNLPLGLWTVPDPEAGAALESVKASGLVVGVISNSNGTVRTALERAGLARDLDFVIDSGVVGLEKPDPRIFHLALEHAGVPAAEACYVGDLYSVDVVGARRVGLDAVLLDPGGYWGLRDCASARGLGDTVRLALSAE